MNIILNKNYKRNIVENLYLNAFPETERKPFEMILELEKHGKSNVFSIEDESHQFLGLAITLYDDNVVILDYFAINPTCRGKGIGGKAIDILKNKYKDKKFLLEIETTETISVNIQNRIRRKNFYLKHGLKTMPYKVNLLGEIMEIMTFNCEVTFEEYHSVFENSLPKNICDKITEIY